MTTPQIASLHSQAHSQKTNLCGICEVPWPCPVYAAGCVAPYDGPSATQVIEEVRLESVSIVSSPLPGLTIEEAGENFRQFGASFRQPEERTGQRLTPDSFTPGEETR